jgi:hypothetical protein
MGKNFGTLGTSLVQIEDYTELRVVQRVCRGDLNSNVAKTGCWIGLQDASGTGYFNWRDPASMVDLSFRNWRRRSDRSDRLKLDPPGSFINNGDNCVHLVPWQHDPQYEEEGSMREVNCVEEFKSFVCQLAVAPHRFTLTTSQFSVFSGGAIIGGQLHLLNSFNFTQFTADEAAVIIAESSSRIGYFGNLVLLDGTTFVLGTDAKTSTNALIGEPDDEMTKRQPVFNILSSKLLNCFSQSGTSQVTINARVEFGLRSQLHVHSHVTLSLRGGGELSQSNVILEDMTANLIVDGYAMRMMTYDAFDLTLSHRFVFFFCCSDLFLGA